MPKQSTSSVHSADVQRKRIRRRIVEVRGAVIRKPDGSHLGGMLILRDVTDERRVAPSMLSDLEGVTKIRELTGKKLSENGEGYFKQILDQMPQVSLIGRFYLRVSNWHTYVSDGLDYNTNGFSRLLQQPVV